MYYRKIKLIYTYLCILVITGCSKDNLTFHHDIKPIIHSKCAVCHNPTSVGPFDLITYQDITKRTKMIEEVIKQKYMPPWPADPNYREFLNQVFLTNNEKEKIVSWINSGKHEGVFTSNHILDSLLCETNKNQADLKLYMKNAHITNGSNQDEFLMMAFPFELEKDTFIKKIEFIPDNKSIVHHINAHLINYNNDKKQTIPNEQKSVNTELFSDEECFNKLDILNDDGTYPILTPSVSNYLPGSKQTEYPDGIGGFIGTKKNILLVNDFHYAPTPYPEKDSSYFKIYFDDSPTDRKVQETQLGTFGISEIIPPLIVPPNKIKKFKTEARITEDISLLTINPHMHLLGKSFLSYAITLSNDTIPLIKIDDWNFRWQYFYTFKKMLKIPAGSRIIVEAIYVNTHNNTDNPFSPTQTVSERKNLNGKGSMKTSNEMLQFIINYLPYHPGDENISLEI